MPHLTLEYTANLEPEIAFRDLFPRLHQVLSDEAAISIGNCKSRAARLNEYCVGAGESRQAFVHLVIRLMEGRATELKQRIGRRCLEILEETFVPQSEFDLQITVEIQDITRPTYLKIPAGTL